MSYWVKLVHRLRMGNLMGIIQMSKVQFKRYKLAKDVIDGHLTIRQYSELIGKSYRQSQRIIDQVRTKDELGVLHGNIGSTPHNKTSVEVIAKILDLLKNKYQNFNIIHFLEMARKFDAIKVKKDVVYNVARKHNLVKNQQRRGRRSHKPRQRLPSEGMMIQFDGSQHNWFGDQKTDLIGGIDDATGKVLAAEFFYGETSNNSMKVVREIIDKNGLPESFYMDQAGIYGKVEVEWESQIARAFDQTGIKLILASSSQAKGRIERLWRTFQDRLIAELKFYQITKIEEANNFLKNRFIPEYNKKFSIEPANKIKSYRKNIFGNLDIIFCKKVQRKIGSGNVFSWEGVGWVIDEKTDYKGRYININIHLNGETSFDIMGRKTKCRVHFKKRINLGGNHNKLLKTA